MSSSLEFIIAMVACVYSGATFIPVPPPKTKNDVIRITKIMDDCGVSLVFCLEKELSYFEAIQSSGYNLKCVSMKPIKTTVDETEDWQFMHFIPHQNNTVVIQYTSGSTNQPKGVLISEHNILHNHEQIVRQWRFSNEKTFVTWLPHFHDMGLFGGLLYPLLTGMKVVKMSPEDFIKKPDRWLSAIDRFKAYCSGGPAFAFEICLDVVTDEQLQQWDLSCWQVAFCGADFVPSTLLPRFRTRMKLARFKPEAALACYGLAENTLFVAGQRHWHSDVNSIAVESRIFPGVTSEGCYIDPTGQTDIKIIDSKTQLEVVPGEEGEICISGASLARSYNTHPFDNIIMDERNWLKTGDVGCIRNRCLFITGRIEGMLVIHGRNLYPNDIALSVSQFNDRLNPHASALVRDNSSNNSFIFLIEQKYKYTGAHENSLAEAIKQHVWQEFGISVSQVHILKRGALPKTTSGKVKRFRAAEDYPIPESN